MPFNLRNCTTCTARYNYDTIQSCPICTNYIPIRPKPPEIMERNRRLNKMSRERVKKRKLEAASKGWKSYDGNQKTGVRQT